MTRDALRAPNQALRYFAYGSRLAIPSGGASLRVLSLP